MRLDDISPAPQVPASHYTANLYMPTRKRTSQMTLKQAKRGMCSKSGGNPQVCAECPAACRMGMRVLELLGGAEDGRMD